ncbi:MAG: zinc ribbon domain-containing protein [Oscillospiraceae bacterium]|jgi:predicted amidophosphoribosyltransferase|nr:zinc ribbon domain-containing protein [Oscillospiraceae bacterium]
MDLKTCPKCGAKNAPGVRFCNDCGQNLTQAAASGQCSSCGQDNPPGTKFCGGCGNKLQGDFDHSEYEEDGRYTCSLKKSGGLVAGVAYTEVGTIIK